MPSSSFILLMIHFILGSAIGFKHSNLKYYETIHADDVEHEIVKRGTQESNHEFDKVKQVKFDTLGREFRLILSPKKDMLLSDFKAYSIDRNGRQSVFHTDYDNFFNGRVFGEVQSFVSVHIDDGVLTGLIQLSNETYHVEPSWRHFPDMNDRTMITYRSSDIKFDRGFFNFGYDNLGDNDFQDVESFKRQKRHLNQTEEISLKKTRCSLLLVADYSFFQTMGGGSKKNTANYLFGLIDRVNKIYLNTVWEDLDNMKTFKNIGFVIKQISVYDEPGPYTTGPFCDTFSGRCDVQELLKVFSQGESHGNYCMAHLFTDHQFNGNVGGYAYRGMICNAEYFENGNKYNLNTALSTSRNHDGDRVITRVAELVISHEFGHIWGAKDDPGTPECVPGSNQGGQYLMHMYSVSAYDVNNDKFSPCSRADIGRLLVRRIDKCFSEPTSSFCGNQRVEGEEECDAGLLGVEGTDLCCNSECKLRNDAICSDINSDCCNNCRFIPAHVICREAFNGTCYGTSFCNGWQADCPPSPPVADGTECLERGRCRNGNCVAYCETLGKQSCMCDNAETTCLQCCRDHMNSTCSPIYPLHFLSDGTPCMNGFCDQAECIEAAQDFVGKLRNILYVKDGFLKFLKDNIVGAVIIVTVALWIPASFIIRSIDNKRQEMRIYSRCSSNDLNDSTNQLILSSSETVRSK